MLSKCGKCGETKPIPHFLKECYTCAYPKFKHVSWTDLKKGDIVYLAGNTSYDVAENGGSWSSKLIPKAYGPHTVEDPEKRTLFSGSTKRVFTEMPDELLVRRSEDDQKTNETPV